jgi:hypothetical protein
MMKRLARVDRMRCDARSPPIPLGETAAFPLEPTHSCVRAASAGQGRPGGRLEEVTLRVRDTARKIAKKFNRSRSL